MFEKKLKFLPIINSTVLFILLLLVFLLSFFKNDNKIVSVNNLILFEEFKMTKEMKSLGNKEFISKKTYLDSLYLKLQEQNLDNNEKESLMKDFVSKREEFDQFNQTFAAEESDKIWKRIESYTKEFAKEKEYKLVLGSNENQNILFTSESLDVTNELLVYINKKYVGL